MCSLRGRLEGECDGLISPDARSPGKKKKKEEEEEEEEEKTATGFAKHLPPELKPTLWNVEFIPLGMKSGRGSAGVRGAVLRFVNVLWAKPAIERFKQK
ncbi:hypothetical protein F2P81_000157 [Scophthalmus maximus]|uniref:Uncharacterized protein n=1 Tax=Scophthalmus maximus TaxID=52904 RepID=A0A6A4TTG6_SCOMX|nr:hypothetical protein F2P81_000157 [Scophthalmus maximus]